MSAGNFTSAVYANNEGTLFPARVQPETLQLTLNSVTNDTAPGTAPAGNPSVLISGTRRATGVIARKVNVRLTADGTGNKDEYREGTNHSIPVFQESIYNGYARNQTGTYLGIACICTGKTPEYVN